MDTPNRRNKVAVFLLGVTISNVVFFEFNKHCHLVTLT